MPAVSRDVPTLERPGWSRDGSRLVLSPTQETHVLSTRLGFEDVSSCFLLSPAGLKLSRRTRYAVVPLVTTQPRFHADRAAGGDCHHRHPHRPAGALRAKGARGR